MAVESANSVEHYRQTARNRTRVSALFALVLSVTAAALLLAFPPGRQAVFLCAGIAFVVVTWRRPVVGVAAVLFAILLFEQFYFASFRPVTMAIPSIFESASGISLGDQGFGVSSLEIVLAVIVSIVVLRATVGGRGFRTNPLALPASLFFAAIVMWSAYGLLRGGAISIAVNELRALAYYCVMLLVVPQVVESERDTSLLLWVAICTVGLKAAQGIWNYAVVLKGDLSGVRSITSHEDALFIAWMFVLLVALLMYRALPRHRIALLVASPVMGFTFVQTDRRAAYVAFAVGLTVLAVLVATDRDRRALLVTRWVPALLMAAVIVLAGWGITGPLGRPAAVVRSIVAPDNAEDAGSSYFRVLEERNLIHAVESHPVLGLGFGLPFQTPGQGGIAILHYEMANYTAHNSVFWIWANMGTLGFALFWALFGGLIAFGCVVFRSELEPDARAVAAFVTCAVAMQLIVGFVDLQLTYSRNMIFLGVLVGILVRLPALYGGESTDAPG